MNEGYDENDALRRLRADAKAGKAQREMERFPWGELVWAGAGITLVLVMGLVALMAWSMAA